FIWLGLLAGCIGDDIIFDTVPETLRIINPVDTLAVGDTVAFKLLFTNNIGQEEQRTAYWSSSDETIVTVDDAGSAIGISKGTATLTATVDLTNGISLKTSLPLVVDAETTTGGGENQRRGTIKTTSTYELQGDFVVTKEGSELVIEIADNYEATSALPGLYVYLSNNPNSKENALEIGPVEVFKGAHNYRVDGDIALNRYDYLLYYCKPFNVKVGDGKME
ncbi:MAG: DM13 domain-containing protein, partial [Lewinella sp.]|nr:DM13 domain-containing protein [Lewinella sp.]